MATLEPEQVRRIIKQLNGAPWIMVRDRATDEPYVNAKFYPREGKLLWESVEGLL